MFNNMERFILFAVKSPPGPVGGFLKSIEVSLQVMVRDTDDRSDK